MSTTQIKTAESPTRAAGTRTVCLFFFAVALACAALAFHFRRAQYDAVSKLRELEQASGSTRSATRLRGTAPGRSTQDYELLAQLARKDATISELRRKLGLPPTESRPAGNPLPTARAKPASRTRVPRTETGQDHPAPAEPARKRALGDVSELEQFFNSVDTSRMTPDQYGRHTRLVERISVLQGLLKQSREATDEAQQQDLDRQVKSRVQDLEGALETGRNSLLFNAGLQLGYDESSAQWFVDYVKYVYQITSPESVSSSVWRSSPQE